MTTHNKFYLKDNGSEKKLTIRRCREPPTRDTWHEFDLSLDELDELLRILGVGMGDCDHCPAWKPYVDNICLAKPCEFAMGLSEEIDALKKDLSGHAGEHMKNNLVEKVKNLETKTDNILKYNGMDWKATNSRIWEHHGKIMDITKVLNDVSDELHKVKDFVGMK